MSVIYKTRTTMSSDLSSYGSLSRPSGLRRSPLMNVPLELLTSLMKIYSTKRSHQRNFLTGHIGSTHLPALLPDFCMLSTQNLGVKIAVVLCRYCPGIRLSTDFDALVGCEVDMFYERICV